MMENDGRVSPTTSSLNMPPERAYLRLLIPIVLAVCVTFSVNTSAATRRVRIQPLLDDDYVSALTVANHFLHAWQNHDQETVVLLLTDAAKQRCSETHLDSFLSSGSRAYEVGRGRKLPGGRYAFPITIFAPLSNNHRSSRPHYTELIVAQTPKNDWAVDKLP
jgi:hypothetical protein